MAKAKKTVKVKKVVKKVVNDVETEEEQEQEEQQEVETVRLVREPVDENGLSRDPVECDCHPDEVGNFVNANPDQGWRVPTK